MAQIGEKGNNVFSLGGLVDPSIKVQRSLAELSAGGKKKKKKNFLVFTTPPLTLIGN